jgi:hypothetical protein
MRHRRKVLLPATGLEPDASAGSAASYPGVSDGLVFTTQVSGFSRPQWRLGAVTLKAEHKEFGAKKSESPLRLPCDCRQ